MDKKTLLIISGGIEAVAGIKLAKSMGLTVVVSDGYSNAPGFKFADHQIIASTYDVDETVRKATLFHNSIKKLDGVICMAADVPHTVASVAEALGLPGIPLASAKLSIDKLAMKEKFESDGINIPRFTSVNDVSELAHLIDQWEYPVVLKPVDSRGSRGVIRITEDVDLTWAWTHSLENSPTGRVMVEKFLDGPQVSTESIVTGGVCHTIGFSDRNYEYLEKYAPFIIENGGDLPSFLPMETQNSVKELVNQTAKSIGVTDGVVKGDIVIHQGSPYVIEVATRLSGGHFCSHEIPLNTGVDFVGSAIKIALGEPIDSESLLPRYNRNVCQRYLSANENLADDVDGLATLESQPGIEFAIVNDRVHTEANSQVNSSGWRAMAIACGENREDAQKNVNNAFESIRGRSSQT